MSICYNYQHLQQKHSIIDNIDKFVALIAHFQIAALSSSISVVLLKSKMQYKNINFIIDCNSQKQSIYISVNTLLFKKSFLFRQIKLKSTFIPYLERKIDSLQCQVKSLYFITHADAIMSAKLQQKLTKLMNDIFQFFWTKYRFIQRIWIRNIQKIPNQTLSSKTHKHKLEDHILKMVQWKFLRQLIFSANISPSGIKIISEYPLKFLNTLTLRVFYLNNTDMLHLIKANCPILQYLDVTTNDMTVDGVKIMMKHCFFKLFKFKTQVQWDYAKLIKLMKVNSLRLSLNFMNMDYEDAMARRVQKQNYITSYQRVAIFRQFVKTQSFQRYINQKNQAPTFQSMASHIISNYIHI